MEFRVAQQKLSARYAALIFERRCRTHFAREMDYSHPKTPIVLPAAQVASSAKGKDNWPTALQLPTYLQHVCSKQRLRVPLVPADGRSLPTRG